MRIEALRKALDQTQQKFAASIPRQDAKKKGFPQSLISAWQFGSKEPSPDGYIGLANLAATAGAARSDDVEWFLKKAGARRQTLSSVANKLAKAAKAAASNGSAQTPAAKGDYAAVLADIEARIAQLQAAAAGIRAIMGI